MKVSVHELKDHLSEYLRRAESGEEIDVTSHNRVVARLVAPETKPRQGEETAATLLERLKMQSWVKWKGGKPTIRPGIAMRPGGKTIAEMIREDRR